MTRHAATPPTRRPNRAVTVSVVAFAALGLAACGSDDDASPVTDPEPPPTSPPVTEPATPELDLDGREFVSTSVEGYDLVDDTTITISFADGSLSASAGCNTIFGEYEFEEGRLKAPMLGTTDMGCEPDLMAQDRWLTDIFSIGSIPTLDGDTLTLAAPGGATLVLVDRTVADPDRPLDGIRWVLEDIRTQDAVSTVPEGVVASITFDGAAALVEAGCNRGSSSVTITDDTITFGPLALTRMMCEADAMEVENAMASLLDGEVAYSIDADRLTLDSLDIPMEPGDGEMGGTGLGFRADD